MSMLPGRVHLLQCDKTLLFLAGSHFSVFPGTRMYEIKIYLNQIVFASETGSTIYVVPTKAQPKLPRRPMSTQPPPQTKRQKTWPMIDKRLISDDEPFGLN